MTKASTSENEDRDLTRRREATRGAQTDVERSGEQLRSAREALALHDAQAASHRTAIDDAKRMLAVHRQALRALDDDRDRLRGEVQKARKASEKAARRATKAEQRYERSVLASLVDREKDADRRAHPTRDGSASGSSVRPGSAPVTGRDDRPRLRREPTGTGTKVTLG